MMKIKILGSRMHVQKNELRISLKQSDAETKMGKKHLNSSDIL